MSSLDDPEFLEALQRIFATRSDIKAIADYQQKLFANLSELNSSHRAVYDHVRTLTESHNRGQSNTNDLVRGRKDLEKLLQDLQQAHQQTVAEVRQAMRELYEVQQNVRKVRDLEDRIARLERELSNNIRGDQKEERLNSDQEQRLRRLESRK